MEFHADSPTLPGIYNVNFDRILRNFTVNEALAKIIRQTQDITVNLNLVHQRKATIHPLALREDITWLQYALLSFEIRHEYNVTEEIYHLLRLSYLMYLITLVDEVVPGTSNWDDLGRKLITYLQKPYSETVLTHNFVLWVCFCAASVVKDIELRRRILRLAENTKSKLGISSWNMAEVVFRSFYWVEKIHQMSFARVWRDLIFFDAPTTSRNQLTHLGPRASSSHWNF